MILILSGIEIPEDKIQNRNETLLYKYWKQEVIRFSFLSMSTHRYELLGGSGSHNENRFRKGFLFSFVMMLILFGLFYHYLESTKVVMQCPAYAEMPTTVSPTGNSENATTPATTTPTTTTAKPRVWDTMDGEGYQFEKETTPVVLDPRFEQLNNLAPCENLATVEIKQEVFDMIANVKKEFLNCINPIVNNYKGKPKEMFLDWVPKAEQCDQLKAFESLGVVPFENLHETKWAVLPKCKEENTLLTLGIGHDTIAEEKFNRTVPNTKFYGADPIIEPNRQMYSAFGKFFPFAIGKQPGFTKFRVLPNQNQKTRAYVFQDVTTIPFLYFVNDILKFKRIDFAWIDIEGGEFEFLDQLHKDVTICQFNVEMHMKFRPQDGAEVFHDFIFKVLEDQKYIFMKSLHTEKGVHRMFFINTVDRECLAKFFS